MPTYEYVCVECDKTLQIKRGINSPEVIPSCPECGYQTIRSWNFTGSINFKGSGFYSTDKKG